MCCSFFQCVAVGPTGRLQPVTLLSTQVLELPVTQYFVLISIEYIDMILRMQALELPGALKRVYLGSS